MKKRSKYKQKNNKMKIEIRKTKEDGIIQITTLDERWYQKGNKFVPSVTWIAGHYPKGVAFYKWLADKGWDEAEAIKNAAGDRGSKVHQAIDALINKKSVKMDDKFSVDGELQELTPEEYEVVMSFASWFNEVKPEVVKSEFVVWNEERNYAGTVDLLCKINGELWLIDYKTSQNLWPEHELQVSAYKHAVEGSPKLGILQVGYRRNKNKWKMNEVEDRLELFLAAQKIWAHEQAGVEPKQRDYPRELKLDIVAKKLPPKKKVVKVKVKSRK